MRISRKVKIDTKLTNQHPGVVTEQRQRLAFLLRRCHGQESEAWIELLLQCTMSIEGVDKLVRLNPFISRDQAESIISLCVLFMFVSNRIDHVERCLSTARAVLKSSSSTGEKDRLQSEKLAQLLRTKRHYISNNTFDPRLLAFEFIHNIILRKSQVELINTFKQKIKSQQSTCHQMLMGSGKTTVVAPLLCLILNKFATLTTQVYLVRFGIFQIIVRQRFSAIVCKPVYTFRFDRFNGEPANVHANLLTAASTRGIVISDPTSLKSFALKFLELLNARCELTVAVQNHKDALPQRGALLSLMNRVAVRIGLARTRKQRQDLRWREQELCCKRHTSLYQILKLFNNGVLILDEGLILHPLKSELNWPLRRTGLYGRRGCEMVYAVPSLDAVFYAGECTVMNLKQCGNNVVRFYAKFVRKFKSIRVFDLLLTPHFVLSQRRHCSTILAFFRFWQMDGRVVV